MLRGRELALGRLRCPWGIPWSLRILALGSTAASRRPLGLAILLVCGLACAAPEDTDLDYHRALNAQALGRHDWARHYFAQDLEQHPQRLESLLGEGIGWISGHEGSLSFGAEALERYLRQRPEDPEARLHLARSYFHLRKTDRALALLEGAEPGPDLDLLRAQLLEESQPDLAAQAIDAALEQDPQSFAVRLQAAKVRRRRGEISRAIGHAREALALDPLREEVYVLLTNLQRQVGQEEEAVRTLELYRMVSQLPAPQRRGQLSSLEEAELLERLRVRLSAQEEMAGVPVPLLWRLAEANLAAAASSSARAWIDQGLADPDTRASDLARVGQVARERGHPQLARELYEAVLQRQPQHLGALTQLILLHLDQGEPEAAESTLRRALLVDPLHGPFHHAASRLNLARRQEAEAEVAARRALQLVPWVPQYRVALADLLLARGAREDAVQLLAEAPTDDPLIEAYRRRLSG